MLKFNIGSKCHSCSCFRDLAENDVYFDLMLKFNICSTSESVDPLTLRTHACTETRQEQVHISIDYDLRMLYYHIGLL